MAKHSGPDTAERFVDTTLAMIAEQGGSLKVNLRQVSRRMGCAHTNAYNYFDDYGDLLWAAFRKALLIYADHLIHDLDVSLEPDDYVRRVITNLASFPEENPGLYRFIGSDPIDLGQIPGDILEDVAQMKRWLGEVFAAAGPGLPADEARAASDIVLAYIDGETLNLINGRVIPSEDLRGRIVANAMRLFGLLVQERVAPDRRRRQPGLPVPGDILRPAAVTEGY